MGGLGGCINLADTMNAESGSSSENNKESDKVAEDHAEEGVYAHSMNYPILLNVGKSRQMFGSMMENLFFNLL